MPSSIADRFHNFHITVPGSHISGKAVLFAGLAAGVVFLVLELLFAPLFMGLSSWVPVRMIAAITMGVSALSPPNTFDAGALIAATIIHFALSLFYALIFAFIAKGRSRLTDTMLGAGFGLAVYLVNFYGFEFLFPWFAAGRHWATIVSHLAFGAVLGYVYAMYAKRYAKWDHLEHA